jgi:hypothetical protein
VMWRNWLDGNRDMYQAVSADGGKTYSAATKIGTGTWLLAGCPMDGGSLAVAGEETAYVWRREQRLFFAINPSFEMLLAESGSQPVVVSGAKGFGFVWQNQGNLYWKASIAAPAQLLAANAGYATTARSPRNGSSLIAWEAEDGIYLFSEETSR